MSLIELANQISSDDVQHSSLRDIVREKDSEFVRLYTEGLSYEDLAAKFDSTEGSVGQLVLWAVQERYITDKDKELRRTNRILLKEANRALQKDERLQLLLNRMKNTFGSSWEVGVLRYPMGNMCEILKCSMEDLSEVYKMLDIPSMRKSRFWECLYLALFGFDNTKSLKEQDLYVSFPFNEDRVKGAEYAFGTINEDEQNVLFLRFSEGKTLEDVAKTYGLSRERIRSMESHALRELRHPIRLEWFQSGYDAVSKKRAVRREAIKGINACGDNSIIKAGADLISLDEIELSRRTYNGLKRSGANTIGDVLELFESGNINKVRNLGRMSIKEVAEQVRKLGFEIDYSDDIK